MSRVCALLFSSSSREAELAGMGSNSLTVVAVPSLPLCLL